MALHGEHTRAAEHDALFVAAAALIPSLKGQGRVAGSQPPLLTAPACNTPGEVAAALHDHWRQAHPEAGPAYWLTRSWGMLCWQSIYLAMVAVYRHKAVPALDRLGQGYEAGLVSGFCLPLEPMIKGEVETLIAVAGERLQTHWQGLLALVGEGQRLRPGFVRPLLADDLLAALVRVPEFFGEVSREAVAAHAPLWLAACGLPDEHLAGWRPAALPLDGLPGYVRQRCCLHYKRRDGDLCGNCPRRQGAVSCSEG
ncbi:siderophore ferric iron reductase [Aeromonas taiwanensis]|uniref:Siderophore ferric iron reductase n=1 Tax=Aeromonas taiwanensis TaxID=633417 RepID=A0A5F0KEC8_9GAMM|nr:siderophore ferric iron reductase [Aeromonas taiwanensis]TFF78917.1 siderophore ferric iron reductase [Aeromonas taiwanensis]TFF79322.1 siderophore ferric iron reductase [Aeromonas taiwanensis]TFF82669.1 siderophore ferric iron reductase [Aeromonas taiwanensis]